MTFVHGHASAMYRTTGLIADASRGQHANQGENPAPTGDKAIESLTLGGDFRNVALGDMSNILLCFKKLSLENILEQSNIIYDDILSHKDSAILTKLHFLTINPSPEFMYLRYANFMEPADYETQLAFFERLLMFVAQQTDTRIISISAETGKGKGLKPYLHYHLILIQSSNRNYKRFYNAIRNQVTALHLVKGHQTALRESEVQRANLLEGIRYFNGIQPHKKTNKKNQEKTLKLKSDYYASYPYQGL